ncbi:MFS transporter [Actinopolymorpha sp. B17G11]|uniref:MFS transporter n=1 Tax=unclassified Actinopolymorpha TaxID=2627063 RepID=UPI0032D94093
MKRSWVPPTTWTVLGASAMTTVGILPVFLLSSQSVFVRADLDFDERRFGVAVSAFFVAAAASVLLGGGLVDRWGRRTSTAVAGLLTAAGGFGVAWAARSWLVLTVAMVILGVANAACQVTSNVTMAKVVPAHRQGLGFGVKQAAIPLAITLAGLAVPTVGALLGWRWTFALTGFGGLAIALVSLRLPSATVAGSRPLGALDRPSTAALVTTMIAVSLASAAGNSLGAFVASWGFRVGLTPDVAGLLMATGSAVNLVVRVVSGHLADRRHGRNLPVVAAQMLIGAAALAVLSFPSEPTVVAAGLIAFAFGWSWPGLLLYAVVRVSRDAPGAASSYLQAGAFVGGAAGPALFGAVVAASGYETAWRVAAMLFAVAALLVIVARRMFIADLIARPPVHPIGYGGGREAPAYTTSSRPISQGQQSGAEGHSPPDT